MGFLWHEKYCIGVAEIDKQHKTLLEMLNKADEAYASEDRNTIVGDESKMRVYMDILRLREYAFTHFSTEERYMIKHQYPRFFDHKQFHDIFIQELFRLEHRLFNEHNVTPKDLVEFILNWYRVHVTRIDREFGIYMVNRNAGL